MATIQFSSLVSNVTGSVGGTTFSRNRSGAVAKGKVVGRVTTTGKQQLQLQNNIRFINLWNAMTLTERQVWNDYASIHTKTNRYGRTKTLTGYNWFISLNNANYYSAGEMLLFPPPFNYPSFLPTFSLAVNPSGILLQWSEPIDTDAIDVFIYTSPAVRGAASLIRGALRLTQKGTQDYSTTINLTGGWEQAHNLNWSNVSAGGNFLINVMVFAISKSSAVTGTFVSNVGQFTSTGIGAMRVGTTFTIG